jgi:hypothetical protein
MTQRKGITSALILAALGILFSIAYTQSPLYTSNQNQYFLHGLAKAGYGYLGEDWLANTLDPTPVFSYLVALTYSLLHQPALYYVYDAILLGIYLVCLVGIVEQLYPLRKSPAQFWLFLALVFVIHSAALRFAFSRTLGDSWSYILEDGLADQRLLGPVFQPSSFGVLLVVSIYLFLRQKPILAILAAALAATVHPTYLLSAAALTLAYMVSTYQETHRFRKPLLLAGVALLAVTPILIYVYTSFASTPPGPSAKAQEILVNFRIPFHALISRWFDGRAVVKLFIILAALVLIRKTRLFLILLIPFLLAALLTIVQALTANNSLALLFPWRISTFLVPLSTTLILATGIDFWFERQPSLETKSKKTVMAISAGLIGLVVIIGVTRMVLDFQRQAAAPDRAMMAYVAAHNTPGQHYMVPLELQDFRLATGSPVYVEFKSIPYQARDVLEWEGRIQITDLFYKKADCGSLEKLANQGITHVIATPKLYNLECEGWEQLYHDANYAVYRLR